MNFTLSQKLAIATGIVGAATAAFGALGQVMTPTETLVGTVIFGFISASLGTINTVVSSQGSQIRAVAALPGVDRVVVNATATNGIAAAAVDPAQPKIGASSPEARAVLQDTVKAAS